ncbi:hypothetical protein GQ457_09G016290 [Hibiscus cannabinus]
MPETQSHDHVFVGKKRGTGADDFEGDDVFVAKKSMLPSMAIENDPAAALASARHEFGEHGGVNMSIEASTTFTVMEPKTMCRMFSALEGTEAAYCTASGMLAISSMLLQLCSSGGHVIASRTLYGGTHALLTHFFPRACNITTMFVDIGDLEVVKNAIVEGKTKVLYFESMSNPMLTVANISELSRIGHEKGTMVVADNTFAPMVLSPARLDADVVLHSISKFISVGSMLLQVRLSFFPDPHLF